MRDGVVAVVALLIAVLLQATVAVDLRLVGGGPDFVLLAVAALAFLRGPETGALAGFAGGLVLDAVTGQPLGLSSLVFTAVGFWVGSRGERIDERAPLRPLLLVAVAAVAARVGLLAVGAMLGSAFASSELLSVAIVPTAALSVLLAIPLLPALRAALGRRTAPVTSPSSSTLADGVSPRYV